MKKRVILYVAAGIMLVLAILVSNVTKLNTQPDIEQSSAEESRAETEASSEPESETETETEGESITESQTESEPETETETESEIERSSEEESETEDPLLSDPEMIVDFTVPQPADGYLPVLYYDEPVGLGEKQTVFSEYYEDNSFVNIYQYGTYMNIHVARFPGAAMDVMTVKNVLQDYVGAEELITYHTQLDRTFSGLSQSAAWHAAFYAEAEDGSMWIYRATYLQYGTWDLMYLVAMPEAAAEYCFPFADDSLVTLRVGRQQ